jgi:hypothetical protein
MATRRVGPTFIQRSRTVSPKQKAEWHEEEGAGRSHVKRSFFDLNAEDEAAIQQAIDDGVQRMIRG